MGEGDSDGTEGHDGGDMADNVTDGDWKEGLEGVLGDGRSFAQAETPERKYE